MQGPGLAAQNLAHVPNSYWRIRFECLAKACLVSAYRCFSSWAWGDREKTVAIMFEWTDIHCHHRPPHSEACQCWFAGVHLYLVTSLCSLLVPKQRSRLCMTLRGHFFLALLSPSTASHLPLAYRDMKPEMGVYLYTLYHPHGHFLQNMFPTLSKVNWGLVASGWGSTVWYCSRPCYHSVLALLPYMDAVFIPTT